jgi:hypothetical protein
MKLHTLAFTLVAACSLFACDQISDALPEYTLGKSDGIPPVSGSTSFALPQDFKCGTPIADPNKKYTITTSGTPEACTFTFAQDVLALAASAYASHPEIKGAQLVKRVDIDVNKLGVRDDTGKDIVPKDLNGKAFGTTIVTLEDLGKPVPFTKGIEGAPIESLKKIVADKQDIVIPIQVVIVVNTAPTPPAQIQLDFDAQPNLVFGF